jgi:hypothetical protein
MTLLGPYVALDCPFEVEASPLIAPLLAEALLDLRSDDTPRRQLRTMQDRAGMWTVGWDGEEPFIGNDFDHAMYSSLSAINLLAAREGARDCAVLHGGSVAVDGRGVVFVGHSGSGKSTLTAAMAMAGHAYIADEVAAITSDSRIRAFHRPIGLRAGGAAVLGLDLPPGPFEFTYPLRLGHRATLVDGAQLTRIFIVERVPDANSSGVTGLTRLGDC